MGFFDRLFGSKSSRNVEVYPDRIWMSTDAKFAGLAEEAKLRSRSDTVAILLVAHFPDVLDRLQAIAEQWEAPVPCMAVPASRLDRDLAHKLKLYEPVHIDVIVAERHPLPSVDDRLKEFVDGLPCRCRFSHHVSLDDAVIKAFAGDWIRGVLEQLGMEADEAIESEMVTRRIRHAQQKIEGRALGADPADSASDWLKRNCPNLGIS